jgi:hypothetical protein
LILLARWLLINQTDSFFALLIGFLLFVVIISSRSTTGNQEYPEKCQKTTANKLAHVLGRGLLEVTV